MRILPLALAAFSLWADGPLRQLPRNPHYYLFANRPTVLVTSAEHYGAVLNGDFDYLKYLNTLAADRLNLTRIFTGVYREVPGDFGIARNTLAPRPEAFLSPYARSPQTGALDGLNKFDLTAWNPAYWERLKAFAAAAAQRGIVVEVTVFCVYYQDRMWEVSPWHPANNINRTPAVPRSEVLSLKHPPLVALQEAFVRKLVAELNPFDNILYEVTNEPYVTGVADEWERRFSQLIRREEAALPRQHLVARNIANFTRKVEDPDPNVAVLNFHYARPPVAVAQNYSSGRIIGLDETGFDGTLDAVYRIQAWDFLFAGGAHYNNLDYSFAVGHEDGSFAVPGTNPGGGSAALRKQLGILAALFAELDLPGTRPAADLLAGPLPEGWSARALAAGENQYAVYLHSGRVMAQHRPRYVYRTDRISATLRLNLPAGRWQPEWWNPRTGARDRASIIDHPGGIAHLATPDLAEDAAVILKRLGPAAP